jgi:uncharacterized lipoprotein YddW (UPF0748 family)
MLGYKRYKLSIRVILTAIISTLLVSQAFGDVMPWDPYEEYLPDEMPSVNRHLRGTWISTVLNLDWPSVETKNLTNTSERIQKSKEELVTILDKAVELNMNAVFFQVSPEGDSLYQSALVPWSRYLTGTYGMDPGFDPLAFVIEEAHKRNLEIHAWFNPYRVSMNTYDSTKASLTNAGLSVYRQHPEWIRTASKRFVVDPGIPEARQWVISRVMEVVGKYDIDGIHFDDYFYNESVKGEMGDDITFMEYNQDRFTCLDDWRRNNNYLLIKELSDRIRKAKPWVKFGVSPGGVWGNIRDGHTDGSNTYTWYTNYERCFADTKSWVEEELIDYIAPQIYFTFANKNAPYGELATWWSNICRDKNVHLYIGQAFYKLNDDADSYFKGDNAIPELSRQLTFNAAKPEIMGSILFRVNNFNDALKQDAVTALKNKLWHEIALVPVMPWKGGSAPEAPSEGKLYPLSGGFSLSWTDNDPQTVYFAVYRFNAGEKADISSGKGTLIGTVRKNTSGIQEFCDTGANRADNVFYVVTALDRLHNESHGLTISTSQSDYFSDISISYSWAAKAVDALHEKGIIPGNDKNLYYPGISITRGDFVGMIIKAFSLECEFSGNFADVTADTDYYNAIGIAKALGIVLGDGVCFNPQSSITREDLMVVIARTFSAAGIELETAGEEYLRDYYDEAVISPYARDAAASLIKAKLIQGSGGGINPKGQATRSEAAVILHRFLSDF